MTPQARRILRPLLLVVLMAVRANDWEAYDDSLKNIDITQSVVLSLFV